MAEFLSGDRPELKAGDYEYPKWLLVLAFLPIGLVAVGGLIGGAIGGGMAGVNVMIAQQEKIPVPLRAVLMLVTTVLAVGLWFVIAMFVVGTFGKK